MRILNTKVSPLTFAELKDFMVHSLKSDKKLKVSKSNGEFLIRAHQSLDFQKLLNDSDLNIPDGIGVLWSAKYLSLPVSRNILFRFIQSILQMIYSGAAIIFNSDYVKSVIPERLSGVEVFKTMLKAAEASGSGVFLFGATQSDLDGAIKNIRKEFPNLKISGSLNGYDWQKDKKIKPVDVINNTDAKLLIVALGSPLQEEWIYKNLESLNNVRVAVGEGGTLAFISGTFKRAPLPIQKIGLEWLWRLFMNKSLTHQTGSRLKRVWNAVPVFICEVVKWKLKYGAANEKS